MDLNRWTTKAQAALNAAQDLARKYSHQELASEHVLLGLMGQSESLIPALLQKSGVDAGRLAADVQRELDRRAKVQGAGELFLSPGLRKAFESAEGEARRLKDDYLSAEHLLLGLLDTAEAALAKIFKQHGLMRDEVMKALVGLRGHQRVTDQEPEQKFQALEKVRARPDGAGARRKN